MSVAKLNIIRGSLKFIHLILLPELFLEDFGSCRMKSFYSRFAEL